MIDYRPVEKKIEEVIRKTLKDEGHYKTGHLDKSISVKYTNDTFVVTAEDYYIDLDEKFNITEKALESKEFQDWFADYIADQLTKDIK